MEATSAATPKQCKTKIKVQAVIKGFPVVITVRDGSERLADVIANVEKAGGTPPETLSDFVGRVDAGKIAASAPPQAPPECPKHSRKLKESQKPGVFFCPSKDDEGRNGYCEFKWTKPKS